MIVLKHARETQYSEETTMQTLETPFGFIEIDPGTLELGELVVSDEGAELEVTGLDPLRFELAPEEDEDWGE